MKRRNKLKRFLLSNAGAGKWIVTAIILHGIQVQSIKYLEVNMFPF